jgi:hypothetical protein
LKDQFYFKFFQQHAAAKAKERGARVKDSLLTIFWSQPAKNSGKLKDSMGTFTSDMPSQSKRVSEVANQPSHKSTNDNFVKRGTFQESHSRLRSHRSEKRVRAASISVAERNRMRIRHLFPSIKGKSSKPLDARKGKSTKDDKNMFSYPVAGRAYDIPDEVKDELDVMACNEDNKGLVHISID